MRAKGAFLDNYKKEKLFQDNLDEFDDSKYVFDDSEMWSRS